jgi:hypothetical protein
MGWVSVTAKRQKIREKTQEVQMTVYEMAMCWLDINALVVLAVLKSGIAIRLTLNSQESSDRDRTLAK